METYALTTHRHNDGTWECECPYCKGRAQAPVRFGAYTCSECSSKFMIMVVSYTVEGDFDAEG